MSTATRQTATVDQNCRRRHPGATTNHWGEPNATIQHYKYSSADEDIWHARILSGYLTARDVHIGIEEQFAQHKRELQRIVETSPKEKKHRMEYLRDLCAATLTHRIRIRSLVEIIEEQLKDLDKLPKRDQQYQDKLACNIGYKPILKERTSRLGKKSDELTEEIDNLEKHRDVAKIDHPKHALLSWAFCYTTSCAAHYGEKAKSGYWPSKKTTVYWPDEDDTSNDLPIPGESSEN